EREHTNPQLRHHAFFPAGNSWATALKRASASTSCAFPDFDSLYNRRRGRAAFRAAASDSHCDVTKPSASRRRRAGYTVPLGRPVTSMMSKPNSYPRSSAWSTNRDAYDKVGIVHIYIVDQTERCQLTETRQRQSSTFH